MLHIVLHIRVQKLHEGVWCSHVFLLEKNHIAHEERNQKTQRPVGKQLFWGCREWPICTARVRCPPDQATVALEFEYY